MSAPGIGDNSADGGRLTQMVERIERLEAEIAELNADKSDLYKEAKGSGFDVAALREVIGLRRKENRNPAAFAEKNAIVDLYLNQLDAFAGRLVHARSAPARTREAKKPEPATPVAVQSGGARTKAQGSDDVGAAGSAAEEADHYRVESDQSVTVAGAAEGAAASVDAAPVPDGGTEPDATPAGPVVGVRSGATAGETAPHSPERASTPLAGPGAGEAAVVVAEPAPKPRAEPHDFPRKPLPRGGMMWLNFVQAYGWPEEEVQARWQAFVPSSSPASAAVLATH